MFSKRSPGARATNDISIEFKIRKVLWFLIYSTDHNKSLHASLQLYCRDVCNISLWSVEYISNQSTETFGWISNSIETSFQGQAPGLVGNQVIIFITMQLYRCNAYIWMQTLQIYNEKKLNHGKCSLSFLPFSADFILKMVGPRLYIPIFSLLRLNLLCIYIYIC